MHRDIKSKAFNARKQNVDKPGSPFPEAIIYEDVTPLRSRICISCVIERMKMETKNISLFVATS